MGDSDTRREAPRVAVVIPTHWAYRMGGSQFQAKLLIEYLYRHHRADIAYFAARTADETHADHKVVRVGNARALRRFGHFWDYFHLQGALRKFGPDVIYQRVGCAYTGISARYARKSGTPLIWHMASQKDSGDAPPALRLLGRPHVWIETRLAKYGARHADVVVAQSRDQADRLRNSIGRAADRVISNFHPVPDAVEKRHDRLRVIWIANLKPIKRPERLFDVAASLGDNQDIEFVMVGRPYAAGEQQRHIDDLLRKHPNVTYLGGKSQQEVNELLSHSHLLMNTSDSEGFSNTFIQAWMHEVPVFTLGVNPDGLLAGNGLGSCFGSPGDMATEIRALATRPAVLKTMGTECRRYAIRHFSMDNVAELSDLIMETALHRRGGGVREAAGAR